MEAFNVYTGKEYGVEWIVDTKTKVNPVIIIVKSDKGNETYEYNCEHEPIFGYDVYDIYSVNKKLNELIEKYKTEKEKFTKEE